MADLARIKRNVAKMASMNAPEADIDGYIASEGVTIDDVRNYRGASQLQPMTEEQKAQARELAQQIRPKKTRGDKIAEFMVTNPVARQVGFGLQGIANAGLNPAGYVARAAGVDTKPLEAQTAGERATELAGQYGYDAAALVPILGLAAGSAPAIAPYVAPLVEGGVPLALTGSTGSALLTGMIDPENPYARIATDILGGGLGAGLTRPKFTAPKQDVKTVKELSKTIGEDALVRDIAESERTGRSLLEVGGDEVLQAAQRAKQQTPEARGILNDYMQQAIEQQPARTERVINQALGTQGKNATIAQVMENEKAKARPIFKELENIGDLAKYEIENTPEQKFRLKEGIIVDEKGEPLKLYHGSDMENIEQFDKDMGSSATDAIGSWFGVNRKIAEQRIKERGGKGRIYETNLAMKNPLTVDSRKDLNRVIAEKTPNLSKEKEIMDMLEEDILQYPQEYNFTHNDFKKYLNNEETKELRNKINQAIYEGFDWAYKDKLTPYAREALKNYDGVKIKNDYGFGETFVAFEPEQINILSNKAPESQLAKAIKNNDVLADTISRVKRANSSLKNLPDTDFRVVNEARKALSQASMNRTELSGYEARQALNELDPILNNITEGKFAQANKLYSDAYQFERAADLGRDVFNSRKSPDDLKTAWNNLSSSEKQAAKIGLREEMMNKIGSATNETNALNRFLPKNTREKIITIAGEKEGGRIIDEAEQAVKLRRNFNQTFGGSPTADRQTLRDKVKGLRGFIRNPWDTTADVILAPFDNASNVRMAEYLTNPKIADAYKQVKLTESINAKMPKIKTYKQTGLRAILERLNEEKE